MDYVNANPEANIGLVAYAGDAFVISPITQDAKISMLSSHHYALS